MEISLRIIKQKNKTIILHNKQLQNAPKQNMSCLHFSQSEARGIRLEENYRLCAKQHSLETPANRNCTL